MWIEAFIPGVLNHALQIGDLGFRLDWYLRRIESHQCQKKHLDVAISTEMVPFVGKFTRLSREFTTQICPIHPVVVVEQFGELMDDAANGVGVVFGCDGGSDAVGHLFFECMRAEFGFLHEPLEYESR